MSDQAFPLGFNMLHNVPMDKRALIASSLVDAFKASWGYTIATPDLDQFLYMGLSALLDMPDATLLGLKFILTPTSPYRNKVLSYIKDPIVKDFWATDFEQHFSDKDKKEKTQSTLNKIRALVSDPTIRNVIGQKKSSFNLSDIIKDKQILLVSLPQGKLGIEKSRLIGSLLLAHLHHTAMAGSRTPFHVYLDEAHHFGTSTLI